MVSGFLPGQMERYRRGARARLARQQEEAAARRNAAWVAAREAARMLKEEYAATRVVAFGSLAHGAWFSSGSDIDLAAEGIPPDAYWRAWCALDHLQQEFEIELVAIESASDRLLDEISRQGGVL
ncbi:MAG: nucleotidyltransferase domain-containing protein [Ardenticatenia bacterium]|nr:nucleotidyltransferase domain-containing protein [Ardenticatenia bacterium]